MKFTSHFFTAAVLLIYAVFPGNLFGKDKLKWAGTYVNENGSAGIVIENEGNKLWVEIWRDYQLDEEKRPGETRIEQVYFAAIQGNTAVRLPPSGEVCPHIFTKMKNGLQLETRCKLGPPIFYNFKRVK